MNYNTGVLFLLILLCVCCSSNGAAEGSYSYGVKINYSDRQIKKLPDLSLRFLGKRHVESSIFRPGFTYYDFEVAKENQIKQVSWSSGTGDIGPQYFEVGGTEFVLELASSEAFKGFMKEGEMVVWAKFEYEKMLKQKK